MLIDLYKSSRKHRMKIHGVIHVGGHWGQEYEVYKKCGAQKIIFIEPLISALSVLHTKFDNYPDVKIFSCACGSESKEVEMNVETANQGQSSSILNPKEHLKHYPSITFDHTESVTVELLDNLDFERKDYNMLAMDVQGYELEVLKGATETLKHIDYIYTEVNTSELYEGCAMMGELTKYLKSFRRVEVRLVQNAGWGDAIFVRK